MVSSSSTSSSRRLAANLDSGHLPPATPSPVDLSPAGLLPTSKCENKQWFVNVWWIRNLQSDQLHGAQVFTRPKSGFMIVWSLNARICEDWWRYWCWFVYLSLAPCPGHPYEPGSHNRSPNPSLLMWRLLLLTLQLGHIKQSVLPDWPDGPEDRPYPLGPRSHPVTHIVSITYPAWKSNYLNN